MRTVITYGTFDLFHKGHYNILKRAKEEGDYLIVGVTGEKYDTERGKLSVQDSLATRIKNVNDTGFADKIIVEEYLGQKISDIIKYHVDVLVIGSDWKGKFDHLRKYCEVKYLERTKDISSTQLREETLKIYNFGIVTDDIYDNDTIIDAKVVSGVHIQSVFAEDPELAEKFCKKFELNHGFSDYDAFLRDVDIVYVKTKEGNRRDYVEKAVEAGKHVITDAPYAPTGTETLRIKSLAEKNNVALMENVSMVYQQAFGQLLWMARGNLIGDIINIRSVISQDLFAVDTKYSLRDLAYYPVCAIFKILGTEYSSVIPRIIYNDFGRPIQCTIQFLYDNAVANAEIYMDMEIDDGMKLIGTDGTICVPEDWWRVGYFETRAKSEKRAQRYSANFDGNGFRYLVQAMLREIRDEEGYNPQITTEETRKILDVLELLK